METVRIAQQWHRHRHRQYTCAADALAIVGHPPVHLALPVRADDVLLDHFGREPEQRLYTGRTRTHHDRRCASERWKADHSTAAGFVTSSVPILTVGSVRNSSYDSFFLFLTRNPCCSACLKRFVPLSLPSMLHRNGLTYVSVLMPRASSSHTMSSDCGYLRVWDGWHQADSLSTPRGNRSEQSEAKRSAAKRSEAKQSEAKRCRQMASRWRSAAKGQARKRPQGDAPLLVPLPIEPEHLGDADVPQSGPVLVPATTACHGCTRGCVVT